MKTQDINGILVKMTDDLNKNIKKLKNAFGSLEFLDDEKQTLLHILVDDKFDEEKCFLAIKSLLSVGMNPNAKDEFDYIFIQTALYTGYSEKFIIDIINLACEYGLNINHVDRDLDTIMHTAICSDDYLGEVINIYKVLLEKGFDSSKLDHNGQNIVEVMISGEHSKQYSEEQINNVKKLFLENAEIKEQQPVKKVEVVKKTIKQNTSLKQLTEKEIEELEQYGKIWNKRQYFTSPTIGRERELRNLQITLNQETKSPIIVGESGVGKTTLVHELVYRIQNNQVPSFLKDKIIFEVIPSDVEAEGRHWVGMFADAMRKVLKVCEKYDVIMFIDEIHTIYGTGAGAQDTIDMAEMLKRFLNTTDIKIIGTTTEDEYNKYFANDALKRRFEKVVVKEPNLELLLQIINKVLDDYSFKRGITFQNEHIREQIIAILMEVTKEVHRKREDKLNNPDLAISIIDKAYSIADVDECEYLEPCHFIESLSDCDRIYDYGKELGINKLKKINTEERPLKRSVIVNFNGRNKK